MKTGTELITEERNRQIEKEGFSLLHDQNYTDDELIGYAMFLLTLNVRFFPKNWDWKYVKKAYARSEFDNQVMAGAMIAANLDRINGKSKPLE